MALANIEVTVSEPNVTVSSDNVNVSVATTSTTVSVGNATIVNNADIRSAIDVTNVSGFGNLTYDNSGASNGIIQYTGVSNADIQGVANTWLATKTTDDLTEGSTNLYATNTNIRNALSNTAPITYDTANGVIGFDGITTVEELTNYGIEVDNTTGPTAQVYISGSQIGTRNVDATTSDTLMYFPNNQLQPQKFGFEHLRDPILSLANSQVKTYIEANGLDATANITTTGNINAGYFHGDGSNISGVSTLTNSQVVAHIATIPLVVGGNLDVNGNLEVSGNLNYRNVEDLYVRDQKITLNANAATDATVEIIANRPVAGANTVLRWNETDDKWQFSNDGSAYNDLLTESQVRGLFSATGNITYASGNGEISSALFTQDVTEGTNLYYTTDRANSAIAAYTGNIDNLDTIGQVTQTSDNLILNKDQNARDVTITADFSTTGWSLANPAIRFNYVNSGEGQWEVSNDGTTFSAIPVEGTDITVTNLTANTVNANSQIIAVHNGTGSTISKHSPVYIAGAPVSGLPNIALANTQVAAEMPAIGITDAGINAGANGNVIIRGLITPAPGGAPIGSSINDRLYVFNVGGQSSMTHNKPGDGNIIQEIGIVVDNTPGSGNGKYLINFVTNEDVDLTNADVQAYIEANGLDATADIDTSVHLGAGDKDYTSGATYWTDNVATTNQFFAGVDADTLWYVPSDVTNGRTRPNIADGSKIVISGGSGAEVALSNGSVTSDNTYYVRKNTPFAGFDVFHLYTDSALSNAVQTGGNVLTNPSELNVSYKAFDVVSNGSVINHNTNTDLQGTLDVTGAITATSTLDVTGNIDTSANINAAGGTLTGVLTSNSNIEMSNSDSIFVGDINGAVQQEVRNETGSTINRGQVVYLTGTATGDTPHVALANNQNSAHMPAIGVIKNNIANASVGEVVTSGEVNIGTHGLALGSDLFVDASGGLTVTHPTTESSLVQKIGKVVNSTHIIVQGAFRTNATPNLDENDIFIGNATGRAISIGLDELTSDIDTSNHIGAGDLSNTSGASYWTSNEAATLTFGSSINADQLWYQPTLAENLNRPEIQTGSKIVISGGSGNEVALSNGSVTADNTYYVKRDNPFTGYYTLALYTDSALSNAVQTGGGNLNYTDPSALNVSYKAFDVVANGSQVIHNTDSHFTGDLSVEGEFTGYDIVNKEGFQTADLTYNEGGNTANITYWTNNLSTSGDFGLSNIDALIWQTNASSFGGSRPDIKDGSKIRLSNGRAGTNEVSLSNSSVTPNNTYYVQKAEAYGVYEILYLYEDPGLTVPVKTNIGSGGNPNVDYANPSNLTITYSTLDVRADGSSVSVLAPINSNSNITTDANISGNYILGNGSQLTGITTSYGNTNVQTWLASGNNEGDIITKGNLDINGIVANVDIAVTQYFGNTNTGSRDQFGFGGTDPGFSSGQAVSFKGQAANTTLTFLNGNVYYVTYTGSGGIYNLYTDSGLTTGLESGLGNESANINGLTAEYVGTTDIQANISGTLEVTGAVNLTTDGSNADFGGNVTTGSSGGLHVGSGGLNAIGGGVVTINSLRSSDFAATDPLALKSYANTSLPTASNYFAGSLAYDSTNNRPVFTDGTNWRYIHDNSIVT